MSDVMKMDLGLIVAERVIGVRLLSGRDTVITVKLGLPVPIDSMPESSVAAPYQIAFDERTRTFRAIGIDGFQAIQLAMKMIEIELDSFAASSGASMTEDTESELGIRFR